MQTKFYSLFPKTNKLTLPLLFLLTAVIATAQTASIYGFVTDKESGEVLIGANVFINETGNGMSADKNGYYVLQGIAPGRYTLVVSYIGYADFRQEITFETATSIKKNIALSTESLELNTIDVSAEKLQRQYNIQPSRVNLSPRMVKAAPALAEPDIFRTIQTLPGVLTNNEASTGLVIRGGNTDQNLILLDGITVYNPTHFGGMFSNFIVDAVKEADLIKGGFNAEYGGRLSAVLNVLSREGNRNKFEGKTSISLLSAQTTMEGPFYKGAWLFSGRRTYFDILLPKILPAETAENIPPYYFYDLQGHVFSDLTEKDRISFSIYNGIDNLIFDDLGLTAKWGNNTYSLAYRRVFNETLVGNFLAASSEFITNFNLGGADGLNSENKIQDLTLSTDFTFFQTSQLEWRTGTQIKQLNIVYLNTFLEDTSFFIGESPVEASFYGKLKYKISPYIIFEPGIRYNYYSVYSSTPYIDLRLGTKYLLTEDRYINFAVGNYHQFIQTIQDDYNPSVLDNWLAVDNSVHPASAQQIVLGYEEYIKNTYKLQVEGYYKDMQNMLTFEDFRSSTDAEVSDEQVGDTFTPSNGYAYGLELFVQKTMGDLTGWIAYTNSVSRKIMNSQISGKKQEYFTNWDRTHVLNILGNYSFKQKWEINWSWTWQSGQAYTPILGFYLEKFPSDPGYTFSNIPGSRNSARYPIYDRLDLGVVYHTKWFGKKVDLFLQVINAYNKENIFIYIYTLGSTFNGIDDDGDWVENDHDSNGNGVPDAGETNVDEEDEGIIRVRSISLFPIIPSIGFTVEF
ncbi:MAG: TonB-dependent receptor [Candidatus Marinimicrobia bacterium]|jgi:hypothetical protein|nr:TonB-dependent receptor [Candidatus Neomarinimicrobiota bacterium]MDP6261457.1 TonB-dependent receptor [Candidatus Neomarinimicrobiota bacterium]MDP7127617.1 TonB-dependent receptor [Candidatus Neomarinimicrobiota bacterium]MDP7336722.1 TonB-dependent receptor [Candidatus Neomarinimicrobiota bacterium]MDP7474404.1 TonB-dependent receptor [Candidatus Neomarinimicrobiota bacterium]|tara:strand:+ start:2034 stop:4421 length:2388 start_codon:yes stop_codon:yes gene_type:complete